MISVNAARVAGEIQHFILPVIWVKARARLSAGYAGPVRGPTTCGCFPGELGVRDRTGSYFLSDHTVAVTSEREQARTTLPESRIEPLRLGARKRRPDSARATPEVDARRAKTGCPTGPTADFPRHLPNSEDNGDMPNRPLPKSRRVKNHRLGSGARRKNCLAQFQLCVGLVGHLAVLQVSRRVRK